jgi:hypothetical protein
MNKNVKIAIGILGILVIIGATAIYLSISGGYSGKDFSVGNDYFKISGNSNNDSFDVTCIKDFLPINSTFNGTITNYSKTTTNDVLNYTFVYYMVFSDDVNDVHKYVASGSIANAEKGIWDVTVN